MSLVKLIADCGTGEQAYVPLTSSETQEFYLRASTLAADKTSIAADGVDAATVRVSSDLESLLVEIDGVAVAVYPAFDPEIVITASTAGEIEVAIQGGGASLTIIAE